MMFPMGRWYLNSFHPLVTTDQGLSATEKFRLPPFIDGSIRREPDFEHPMPGISCLCRAGKFAPRLGRGDTVVYLAVKRRYGGATAHRRLVAILRVKEVLESHDDAAAWYCQHRLPLPSNCMAKGNACVPIARSHGQSPCQCIRGDAMRQRLWDREYSNRARRFPAYRVCVPLFIECTWSAPVVADANLVRAFRRIPGTQNPGVVDERMCMDFLRRLGIPAPLSCP